MNDKTERQLQFYLAGPYSKREHLVVIARDVERRTGWRCTSRWLEGRHDGAENELCAREDIEDVARADALFLYHGKSTRGGMWVELGLALAQNLPVIVFYRWDSVNVPLPVFCSHPRVKKITELESVALAFRWAQVAAVQPDRAASDEVQ